jgi:hypothetical protein
MSTELSVSPTRMTAGALPYQVAGLSTLYAVLGAYWASGGGGYPFGPIAPDQDKLDLMSLLPREFGAGVVAVLGALGVPAALATRRAAGARRRTDRYWEPPPPRRSCSRFLVRTYRS